MGGGFSNLNFVCIRMEENRGANDILAEQYCAH